MTKTRPGARHRAKARAGPPPRRLTRLGRGERGSASVEIAILFPVVLLVITAVVQYGLWFHARSLALAAAQEGVTAARVYQADPTAGTQRAAAFTRDHATDTLTDVTVRATTRGQGRVGIEVTGRALTILPGLPGLAVTQRAEGPVERFTTAGAP
jgi:Flp pilus assembly protein TadG